MVMDFVAPLVTVPVAVRVPLVMVYFPIGIQPLEYTPEALVAPVRDVEIWPPLRVTCAPLTGAPAELTTVTLRTPAVESWKFNVEVSPLTFTALLTGKYPVAFAVTVWFPPATLGIE